MNIKPDMNLKPHMAILMGMCIAVVMLWPQEAFPLLIIVAAGLLDASV